MDTFVISEDIDIIENYVKTLREHIDKEYRISPDMLSSLVKETVDKAGDYGENESYKKYTESSKIGSFGCNVCHILSDMAGIDSLKENEIYNGLLIAKKREDNGFINELDILINELDHITGLVLRGYSDEFSRYIMVLSDQLTYCMPMIIESYSRPEFEEVRGDVEYWVNQLDRIISVMETPDIFNLIDVLVYETRGNLIVYRNMIVSNDIVI